MRIARTAFLTGVLLMAEVGTPAAARSAPAEGLPRSPAGWMFVASPNQRGAGPGGNQLYDVASPDGTAVWAVGTSGQTLAEFLGPNGWEVVRTPRSAAADSSTLRAVAGTSASDVWAVGDRTLKGSRRHPLIERWDGAVWRVVPGAVAIYGALRDVVAIAPDDAWAVGSRLTTTPNAALLEDWNGSGWLPVEGAARPGSLVAVSASDGSNVWAAGTAANGSAFVERWNGSTWNEVPLGPKLPPGARLSDVLVLGPKDAWLAGRVAATAADAGSALTAHWDGSSWSYPAMPDVAGADALASLTAHGSELWAVGSTSSPDPSGGSATLIEHWNGSAWQVQTSPDPGPNVNRLEGVASTGGSIWAVGTFEPANGVPRTLIERLCLVCAR